MKYLLKLSLFLLIINLCAASVSAQSMGEGDENIKKVTAIEVQGNKTISIATVLSKIKTRVGQDYLQNVVSDDLKRLYNTGYFSDVRVDRTPEEGGFKVIIYVEEKAIVEEITFSKTRQIKKKAIEKNLKTQVGKFLDRKSLKDDVRTIEDMYAKKGLTNIEVQEEVFIDEVTNKASLHFIIREGQKMHINEISVYGNASFKDRKILGLLKSKEQFWFIRSGYLQEDLLKEDMERIVSFYEEQGYIDATAKYVLDYLVKGEINVQIEIDEGKRYWVEEVLVNGNQVLSEKEIYGSMENIEPGNIFSRQKLSLDIAGIRTLYFDRGYIFASVNETSSLDPTSGGVQVRVSINEGGLAYIKRVEIEGNSRTKDVVIRRELNMLPGDRFDGVKLRKSKERLQSLGYFEDVSFDIDDTDIQDRKDLVVQVKEAKTGSFSFGGGFSTVDRIVGFVEVEQRNFDLLNWPSFTGAGQQLSLRAETGSSRNNYRLSFTEPWIFGHPISFGVDGYRTERQREEDTGYAYDENRTGGVLRLGKRFTDIYTGRVSYRLEEVEIDNFESNVSADLLAEKGKNTVSVLGFALTRNTTNSMINPTKGWTVTNSVDVAGSWLGGDKDFVRFVSQGSYYIPFKWDSVFEFRLRGGVVNDIADSTTVPIFERFFAGGSRSIRGYEERDVGPLDSVTMDPIGGEALLVGNIEYTIPIIDFLKLAAFFDVGNVWADIGDFGSGGYKAGTGLGLRVKTPIGPVNLDYGYPLDDVPTEPDKKGKFYFSVSRGF